MRSKEIIKIALNLVIIYVIGGVLIAVVYGKTSPVIFQIEKAAKEKKLSRMMPVHLKMDIPDEMYEKVKKVIPDGIVPEKKNTAGGSLSLDIEIAGSQAKRLLKKLGKAGAQNLEEYSLNKPQKVGDWEPWRKHAEIFEVRDKGGLMGYIVETRGKGYSSIIAIYAAVDPNLTVQKINVLSHGETPGLGDEIETDWFKGQFEGKDLGHLVVIKGETEDKIQAITGATISTRAVTNGIKDAIKLLEEKYDGKEVEYTWGPESGLKTPSEGSEAGNEH